MYRLALIVLVSVSACDVGSSLGPIDTPSPGGPDAGAVPGAPDGGDDVSAPDATPQDYAMELDTTVVDLLLAESATFTVTVRSQGFAGTVDLAVTGAPESWTVAVEPAQVVLEADGSATATVTVTVPSDGEAVSALINVVANAALGPRQLAATVNVTNELRIVIPAGTGLGGHPFPPAVRVRLGATVTFYNADTERHRIHSSVDGDGFPHQESPGIAQGESYSVTPELAIGYDYYCHDHGDGQGTGVVLVTN